LLQKPSHLYLHLDLSRNCLLDILIEDPDAGEKFSLLMPLLAHVDRWRQLRFGGYSRKDLRPILAAFKNLRLKKLETVHLFCQESQDEAQDEDPEGGFHSEDSDEENFTSGRMQLFRGGTPCLKELDIRSITALPNTLNHLTHLNLHNDAFARALWSYSEFTHILRRLESLIHLSMVGPIVSLEAVTAQRTNITPNLRSLKFTTEEDENQFREYEEGEGDPYFVAILALFTNTQVSRLYFLQPPSSSLPPILDGMRLGGLRFHHVTELYWGIDFGRRDDAVIFIRAFPAIQRFYLMDTGSNILNTLIKSSSAKKLWRYMHTIHLDDPNLPKARQLVESRIKAGWPLRCLRMRLPKPRGHQSDLDWLVNALEVLWVPYDNRIYWGPE
ncbi:hypothetical protein HWV62_7591, partial [Athelia sp. TMB]